MKIESVHNNVQDNFLQILLTLEAFALLWKLRLAGIPLLSKLFDFDPA